MSREYIDLDELERRTGIPKGSNYHRTRVDGLPGQVRIGRRVLVHWPTYDEALREKMVEAT